MEEMKVLYEEEGNWWTVIRQRPSFIKETWMVIAKFKDSKDAYEFAGIETED